MPTGHNMIIYALAAGGAVSISALIVAGLLPALVLMPCMLAAAYLVAVKRGLPCGHVPGSNAVGRAAIAVLPGLLIIVIILAGILSGVFTATEAAAVAVTYTILLAFLVYRTMTWNHLSGGGGEGGENDRRRIAADRRVGDVPVPDGALRACGFHGNLVATISTTPWIVFLVINVILFVLGTFMDMAATILICTPIFLPIAMKYGMDPVQFGMLMLINCALGLNTPPVGTAAVRRLRDRRDIGRRRHEDHHAFYAALIAALLIVTYVPDFSLLLPKLILGYKGPGG